MKKRLGGRGCKGKARYPFNATEQASQKVKAEEIIAVLRQIEILISQGKTVPNACRDAGITEQTYYRWRKQFGSMDESHVKELNISERKACQTLKINRTTQRYIPQKPDDEELLRKDIERLVLKYGRYGYRKITALLHAEGWKINHKRVERIWKEEGLKVPQKQKKRSRLYFNDGSCVRLRPLHKNHVWSYDFVQDKLQKRLKKKDI